VAGIAILTMSALTLSRSEVQVASQHADRERVEIALAAGFEDATALLLTATSGDDLPGSFRGDDYLVTAVREAGKGPEESARYTYVLRPEGNAYRAIPLFAGGQEEAFPINTGTDPYRMPPMRPTVAWEPGAAPVEALTLPPLTDLRPDGAAVKERDRPKTVWRAVDPAPPADAKRTERYTFWIEDLQGYPDLASTGNPGIDPGAGNGETTVTARTAAVRWGGYGPADARASAPVPLPGDVCLAGDAFQLFQPGILALRDPLTDRTSWQRLTDQAAPGLSPREVAFYPWSDPASGIRQPFRHPYGRIGSARAHGSALVTSGSLSGLASFEADPGTQRQFDWNVENRFTLGLSGYREVPLVPPGFGYPAPAEGTPRRNLNAWLRRVELDPSVSNRAEVVTEIATYVAEMLPLFASRKGAFPEDYLKTLAASIIDYADTDSMSTVENPRITVPYRPANDANAYRGMDNFPLVNEFFLKFTYSGYEPEPGGTRLFFTATPYAELWNPTNRPVDPVGLRINFRFLEAFTVKIGADVRRDIANRKPNGPVPLAGALPPLQPNEYRVARFADYEFSALVQTDEDDVGPPIIEEFKARDRTMAEAHYDLVWNDRIIDMSGRMGYHSGIAGNPPDREEGVHGLEVANHPNSSFSRDFSGKGTQVLTNHYLMRFGASAMRLRHSHESTCYGDPRIAYYSRGQIYPLSYVLASTPGARNANRPEQSRGGYSDVARAWAWPDGGYDPPIPGFSLTGPVEPDQVPPAPALPQFAPWRISNTGRYHSVSELGNIYDPVMWRPNFAPLGSSGKLVTGNLLGRNFATMNQHVLHIATDAFGGTVDERKRGAQEFGGGNTLRIGRPEHPRFDQVGQRAAQLLDLFHVGVPGTNCEFLADPADPEPDRSPTAYARFQPGANVLPPSAPDADEARSLPYRQLYAPDLHASSPYRWIQGQLNLNALATRFELEALLRGPFASANATWNPAGGTPSWGPSQFRERATGPEMFANTLNSDPAAQDASGRPRKTLGDVARQLLLARPFRSPSHVAAAVAQALGPSDRETELLGEGRESDAGKGSALPDWGSDALREETFARILNATTLSSRHFRIHVRGETLARRPASLATVLDDTTGEVVGRATRVYDVFAEPVRDAATGKIIDTRLRILHVRSLP
jgi:hypothetical protein